ncbi:CinA family protein [Spiroplasma endosymbiont of Stenodema calcarata]|uniref:CinA family protein n=1 Tax=Spiroplasma endosymbiont of Stenodema calcarata TaxID=3139328 RepID=UPI003CCB484F
MTEELIQLLQQKQLTIAAYESVTGGVFSHFLTNIPNASEVFLGSIVTYTNNVKVHIGHVPETIIAQYGVVSKQTAEAMAIACQHQFKSDLAVSFTGNAGPGQLEPSLPQLFIKIILAPLNYL